MRRLFMAMSVVISTTQMCGADPVEIEHKFGTTLIEGKPERVVSLSFIGHDFILALGVVPVGLRFWYGEHPYGVWPWAQDALGEAKPTVIYGDIDVEQIALLKPDLILGQWSGMTEREYKMLSVIAPTVPPSADYADYGSPWQVMHQRIGKALGREDQAVAQITAIEQRITDLRAAHPEWQDMSGTMAWPVRIGAFASRDIRGRFLADLGFSVTNEVDDLVKGENFYVIIPPETLEPIDTDVLVWLDTPNPMQVLEKIKLRPMMRASRQGREILVDQVLTSALAHSNPLSLGFALDHLAPVLEAAADGDPDTHARNEHAFTVGAPDE